MLLGAGQESRFRDLCGVLLVILIILLDQGLEKELEFLLSNKIVLGWGILVSSVILGVQDEKEQNIEPTQLLPFTLYKN